jgi:hypothetical protein
MTFPENCPGCGGEWVVRPQLFGQRAQSFASCAYRCERCGIGYSNSLTPAARRRITREPAANVPEEVGDPDAVLKKAANVQNRAKKREAFCSESSEDAVVWTVVSGLRQLERLSALVADPKPDDRMDVLLWGASIDGPRSEALEDELSQVCRDLSEGVATRSEPDIIVACDGHLTFIEAKYGSANDVQPNYRGFSKYLRNAELFTTSPTAVAAVGLYELVRNWVIGAELARRRESSFTLINLGGPALTDTVAQFSAQVAQTPRRRFIHRTWRQVLDAAAPLPDWLDGYAGERGLWTR